MSIFKPTQWKQWTVILMAVGLGAGTLQAQLTYSNGLRLWLKADAGVTTNASGQVSSWADQSTNGFIVSQGTDSLKPLWVDDQMGGQPVLRFDGVDDLLNNTTLNLLSGVSPRTIFIVAEQNSGDDGGALFTFRRSVRVQSWQERVLNATTSRIVDDGNTRFHNTTNTSAIVTNAFATIYAWSGGLSNWLNGVQLTVTGTGLFDENGATGFTIGNREDAAGLGWPGDLSEILVYNHVLAASDRQGVYEYLVEKYALPEPSAALLLAVGGLLLFRRR